MNAIETVNAALKALENHDWAAVQRLTSADLLFVGPMPQPLNQQEFIGLHQALLSAFPDWRFNPSDMTASGDRVTGYVQVGGTQKGPINLPGLPPIPATGKFAQNPREPISVEVKDGKITRVESEPIPGGGVAGLLQQLGVVIPH